MVVFGVEPTGGRRQDLTLYSKVSYLGSCLPEILLLNGNIQANFILVLVLSWVAKSMCFVALGCL